MDIQLKRGILDVCVLAAIRSKDTYGYQIIKDLRPYVELSESTLYTILKRLEAAAMLTVRTAQYGGRLRKYYRITPRGLRRIADFKEEWKGIMAMYQFVVREEEDDDEAGISHGSADGAGGAAAGGHRGQDRLLRRDDRRQDG